VRGIRSCFFRRHNDARVFEKVDSTFFTASAVPLLVVAGWTFVSKRCVTAGTESYSIRRFVRTLRAFHEVIVTGTELCSGGCGRQCAHFATAFANNERPHGSGPGLIPAKRLFVPVQRPIRELGANSRTMCPIRCCRYGLAMQTTAPMECAPE
jgi:hypothetical protein